MNNNVAYVLGVLTLAIPLMLFWLLSVYFSGVSKAYSTLLCDQKK